MPHKQTIWSVLMAAMSVSSCAAYPCTCQRARCRTPCTARWLCSRYAPTHVCNYPCSSSHPGARLHHTDVSVIFRIMLHPSHTLRLSGHLVRGQMPGRDFRASFSARSYAFMLALISFSLGNHIGPFMFTHRRTTHLGSNPFAITIRALS